MHKGSFYSWSWMWGSSAPDISRGTRTVAPANIHIPQQEKSSKAIMWYYDTQEKQRDNYIRSYF